MKKLFFVASLALCASLPAMAQDQAPPQNPNRAAFMQACGADFKSFCSSAQTREDRRACVIANKDKFSDTCKSFMAAHPMHQHPQGQMQGQGGGGQ